MSGTQKAYLDVASELAIAGGDPAITEPLPPMYPGALRIDHQEEAAVLEVLRSRRLFRYWGPNPGPSKVEALEQAFADRVGTTYNLAVTSGTAALICGLVGLDIGPGDEVIVPAYTWIAPAIAALAVGAVPIIAEVDESLTLDPADVERKITPATRAIIAVHMRGAACNMERLQQVARQHELKVLEDVAQSIGGTYHGTPLGSIGDAGTFSFQMNKIVTSGEGGMITTSDPAIYQRALMYHDVNVYKYQTLIPPEQMIPGMNLRMSELQGAVAEVQLRRLDELLAAMRQHKAQLKACMTPIAESKGITFRTLHNPEGDAAIALIFFLPTTEQAAYTSRALKAEGIAEAITLYDPDRSVEYHVYSGWWPVMNKPTWSPRGSPWRWHSREVQYVKDMCPRTLDILGRAVQLDISPDLTERNVEEIVAALHKVLSTL